MNKWTIILLCIVCLSTTSCFRYTDLLSYHEAPHIPSTPQAINNFKPLVIQTNDILRIQISSSSPIAAEPFNATSSGQNSVLDGYLVDANGNIEIPTLGTISIVNLTLEDAKAKILAALQPYFTETPIVNVRLVNFKININGEVGNPGTFNISNNRITMIEAITLAGDFTPYSRRDSILIIREFENERTFGYIDFTSSDVFNSPYFYLQQNDVIYIKPSKLKTTTVRDPATRILPYVSVITGLTALFLSVYRTL